MPTVSQFGHMRRLSMSHMNYINYERQNLTKIFCQEFALSVGYDIGQNWLNQFKIIQ